VRCWICVEKLERNRLSSEYFNFPSTFHTHFHF